MTNKLLEVNNLDVGYGGIQVLRGLSMYLNDNECIGLFGPNGHGKTTLLRTISGLLKPWQGTITFEGQQISEKSPNRIVDLGLIHVAQGSTLFPRMTVQENLNMGAFSKRVRQNRAQNLEKVFELFPRLKERRNQLCRTLSGGERQMVAIGIGLMGDAKVLMLDEPTLGLAPVLKEWLEEAIQKVAASSIPLIVVEQDVEFLLNLTDRLYLIEEGQIALEQTQESGALEHEQIMEMYFGGTDRNILAELAEDAHDIN